MNPSPTPPSHGPFACPSNTAPLPLAPPNLQPPSHPVPTLRRKLFPPTQFSAEFNALIASLGFFWLVGPSSVKQEEVEVAPGVKRVQASVVHIEKCRYLESSGCVGMCVNMCKVSRVVGQLADMLGSGRPEFALRIKLI